MPVNKTFGQQVVIHRADLHNALIHKALSLPNIKLCENSPVTSVQFHPASVTLADGSVVRGDVVIGADGIKSIVRKHLHEDSKAIATGDAAYRIILPRNVMEQDPELKALVDEPQATRWVGPSRHIIAYPVRKHNLYNVVLLHPDRGGVEESWTTKGSKQAMVDNYSGWDQRVRKLIDLVSDDEVLEWKLCLHSPLRTWIRGSVALIGDACHPMLYVFTSSSQSLFWSGFDPLLGRMLLKVPLKQSRMPPPLVSCCRPSRRTMRFRGRSRHTRDPASDEQRLCSSLDRRIASHYTCLTDRSRENEMSNSARLVAATRIRTNGQIARRRNSSGVGTLRGRL